MNGSPKHPHRGVTLIEVLIVIAIIGLLASISIPAIQMAREAARRNSCQNNLHQYGIAFASFEAADRKYPAGFSIWIKGPLGMDPEVRVYNYMAELFPHLGAEAAGREFKLDCSFFDAPNRDLIGLVLAMGVCPSSAKHESQKTLKFVPSLLLDQDVRENPLVKPVMSVLDLKYSGEYRGGYADYTILGGAGKSMASAMGYKIPANSFVGLGSMFPYLVQDQEGLLSKVGPLLTSDSAQLFSNGIRVAQVIDGLANTLLMVEAAGRPEHWVNGKRDISLEPVDAPWADPRSMLQLRSSGDGPSLGLTQVNNANGIYSFHPQVANVLFADGHVQTVDSSVDARLVLAWMTPDQGDTVGQ